MKKRLAIVVGLIVVFLIGVAVGATIVGVINISYIIEPFHEPRISEPMTLKPNPLNLDLGTITGVLRGSKSFPSVATLTVPKSCEITATLDASSVSGFDDLAVYIRFFSREIDYIAVVGVGLGLPPETASLYAGTYDVHVEVNYTAKNVTATGTIVVILS